MRVAVTGAGGLVGLEVVARCAEAGHETLGLARTGGSARRVLAVGGRPLAIPGLELEPLAAAFQGAQAVVHLAQIGREAPGASYAQVNVAGTRAVAQAARRAGVARLVYFSGLGVARYGMASHCTNPYFLSKLACEADLLGSGLDVVVFRPSYVLGPGSELVAELLRALGAGHVPRAGEGLYRLQPVALADAGAAVAAALERPRGAQPFVYDLVGPQPVSFDSLLDLLATAAGYGPRGGRWRVEPVALEAALAAARSSSFLGMRSDDLDCLLSDELGSSAPLEALLGRSLLPLQAILRQALASPSAARSG